MTATPTEIAPPESAPPESATTETTTPLAFPPPTVSVRCVPHYGTGTVTATVGPLSIPDCGPAVDALVGDARVAVEAAVAADGAVRRWRTLGAQLDAARRTVAAADRTVERVRAAQLLLEAEPESDLANKLREVESQHAAALEAKAAAEADLETLNHLIAKFWVPAANAIGSRVSIDTQVRRTPLREAAAQGEADLAAACRRVEDVLARAVAEHLSPLLPRLLAARRAAEQLAHEQARFTAELRGRLVGPVPAGVQATPHDKDRFEPVPPPPPPAPPAPPEPQVRELLPIQTYGGPVRR